MITVERIEGGKAVLECDGKRLVVPLNKLPPNVHEGSILAKTPSGFMADEKSEQKRRSELSAKRREIFRK